METGEVFEIGAVDWSQPLVTIRLDVASLLRLKALIDDAIENGSAHEPRMTSDGKSFACTVECVR
jgi:hypothetical protein